MAFISFGTLLTFAVTCLLLELTPGPNKAYLALLSAGKGRRAGFAATLGVALGLLVVGLAAALGLTALIASSRTLYEALRWGGVLYLLWLAYEGWRGEEETSPKQRHCGRIGLQVLHARADQPTCSIRRLAFSTSPSCQGSLMKPAPWRRERSPYRLFM